MSDFNPRNITAVILDGGKSLTATQVTAQGLTFGNKTVQGLRFRTRVDGRSLWAFTPFTAIIGVYGTAEGEPHADPSITFDVAALAGLFLMGGRLLKVLAAESAAAPFGGGDALRLKVRNDDGTDQQVTVSLSQVIAYLGDLRTDSERENDDADRDLEQAEDFVRTYGTDKVTYAEAMGKQTTYVKATKGNETRCAACGDVFPPSQYIVPVYIAGVGIVHPNNPECQPFTKKGLIAHNAKVAGDG